MPPETNRESFMPPIKYLKNLAIGTRNQLESIHLQYRVNQLTKEIAEIEEFLEALEGHAPKEILKQYPVRLKNRQESRASLLEKLTNLAEERV